MPCPRTQRGVAGKQTVNLLINSPIPLTAQPSDSHPVWYSLGCVESPSLLCWELVDSEVRLRVLGTEDS